jgi:hypothetical protein
VIIGAAFSKIIDSLVGDIIMPIVGRIAGGLDFTNYFIGLTPAASQAATYDAAKKAGATLGLRHVPDRDGEFPDHRLGVVPGDQRHEPRDQAGGERSATTSATDQQGAGAADRDP